MIDLVEVSSASYRVRRRVKMGLRDEWRKTSLYHVYQISQLAFLTLYYVLFGFVFSCTKTTLCVCVWGVVGVFFYYGFINIWYSEFEKLSVVL